ncbi:uncharacterized protein LOC133653724 isoform X1 [Entelurus aequoreus]|uniref:uncharacterized protein LOC133653724 isoform X1 n=1 Tax=Entelurus aequoreus TaxID=161455 RepID=UPI002B1E1538|nr:uncharacterized protein LOC133653724 isoform X1 [Entelurus aequoreus]XP_061909343.1 uncharacterized protein LOC133653724 isoform X1 [Entelurus aequoreus]XP_061909353.1 uncharacterized protein LOC133653724 isoform X1 [Entelurus aequoreus]XP_061909361.1 uncharacterized protein LOC133653724 isoform X1 [Entelurus aequoreus]XP_061909368.1 uncharacterized protein LOC133653724 isoform X1 [Entelurus aequoreus]XP_061909377.1 uncharacterized protein LOC133653724 isoform X1 [Entelurus aequoreus]
MLWKQGLLIKLNIIGIRGKMYRWIKDFLTSRKILVKIENEYSREVENGAPQGSIISPVLFSIMINEVFSEVEGLVDVALFADNGVMWKRGRNTNHIEKKIQKAVNKVQEWGTAWGLRFSVGKTKVIHFTKRKVQNKIQIKLYGENIEEVQAFKYLGIWFDKNINWSTHISKIVEKIKKVLNIMRALRGKDWGADRQTLKAIYISLIRSVIDYGCIIYQSAAKTLLGKIDRIQSQALRLCCGATKSTPVAALQVEMNEKPLDMRRDQLSVVYWANLKGSKQGHPTHQVLLNCQEKEKKKINCFGWIIGDRCNKVQIDNIKVSPTVPIPAIPPWMYENPNVNMQLLKNRNLNSYPIEQWIEETFLDNIMVYTDASKTINNKVGAAAVIPQGNIVLNKIICDKLSVFTGELVAIYMAINWIEENKARKAVVCSDSSSALTSIKNIASETRQDLVYEIVQAVYRINKAGGVVTFLWAPAHVGVEGNELADKYAKQATTKTEVNMEIKHSKEEVKNIIKIEHNKKWQDNWNKETKGREYYKVQRRVGVMRGGGNRNRKEEDIITRMRLGHTYLNSSLKLMGKHATELCDSCQQIENVRHVLIHCRKYNREREILGNKLAKENTRLAVEDILGLHSEHTGYKAIHTFFKNTGLNKRI